MNASVQHLNQVADLQGPLQAAVAKASIKLQVAEAVLESVDNAYLPASELFHKPAIQRLGLDRNRLSIVLSEAYHAHLLGRVDHHEGTTRYAYGKPFAEGAKMSQRKLVAKPTKPVITAKQPVEIVLEFEDAVEAFNFLKKNGLISRQVKAV